MTTIRITNHKLIVSALFTLAFLVGCNNESSDYMKTPSVMDQVLARGSIRAGYISYPPSFIKDANTGKFSGIYYDTLKEASDRLGLSIEYTEEVDWATMTEAVKQGRVDMVVSGIWPTSARSTQADFTDPLYFSSVKAYVRADDSRFDGNSDTINNKAITIAVIDGEMSSIIAKQDFPSANTRALPQTTQISQLLLELQTNKADVTFVEPAVASQYMVANPGVIKRIPGVAPMRVFPNVILIAQGQLAFRSMLNTSITELHNNGVVDKALRKYESQKGDFLRVALPYSR